MRKSEKSRLLFGLALIFITMSSALMIYYQTYRWNLLESLTVIVALAVQIVIYGLFYLALLFSVLVIIITLISKGYRSNRQRNAVPLWIGLLTFGIITFVPFTEISLNKDFSTHLAERLEVIELLHNEQLALNEGQQTLKLPVKYEYLSKGGGEIVVFGEGSQREVLFYTFRGLDQFSGFVYTMDGSYPKNDPYRMRIQEVVQQEGHWYWVSSS